MPVPQDNEIIALQKKALLEKACVLYFLILGALDKLPLDESNALYQGIHRYEKNHGALIQKILNQAVLTEFKHAIIQANQQRENASLYLYVSALEKELIKNKPLHELFNKELTALKMQRAALHKSIDLYQRNKTRNAVFGVGALLTLSCMAGGFLFPPLWGVSIAIIGTMLADLTFDFLVPRNVILQENNTQFNQTLVCIDLIDAHDNIVIKNDIEKNLLKIFNAEKTTTTSILQALKPETTNKSTGDGFKNAQNKLEAEENLHQQIKEQSANIHTHTKTENADSEVKHSEPTQKKHSKDQSPKSN